MSTSQKDPRRLFTDWQVRQLLIACNMRCERCGADLTDILFEAHHIRQHALGGQTQLYNGMILCVPCHREVTMSFQPREWQKECLERFHEVIRDKKLFVFEACMAAGKSDEAAMIAKTLRNDYNINHILVLVPWTSIQSGMLAAFGRHSLDSRDRFFTEVRRQPWQPRPQMDATVTLYQEGCNQATVDTLKMWQRDGWKFALICDEIHHTNEISSSWGTYVEQISQLASYSIFMSGTFFRSDKNPISCIPHRNGLPVKDYRYTYADGVADNVVRSVTTREITAIVEMVAATGDQSYKVDLKSITKAAELSEAKRSVLEPTGKCLTKMITDMHRDLTRTRTKFPDAACLLVCRPGSSDSFSQEEAESLEDKHVHLIANQVKKLTGVDPVVVTHRDPDATGKIAQFRNGTEPYLVAVNMVSEGCDIPRIRAVAFCRHTDSEMLFRQICGRALRIHQPEDGTAAQIYIPAFPQMLKFAENLYREADEGILNRRCVICSEYPCICTCPHCGKRPCECARQSTHQNPTVIAIDSVPVLDGGHLGEDHVHEQYVGIATKLAQDYVAHRHSNPTQLGHALQLAMADVHNQPVQAAELDPFKERENIAFKINRMVKKMGVSFYNKNYPYAYHKEIEQPFGEKFLVIKTTWPLEKLKTVAAHLEKRLQELMRNANGQSQLDF